MVGLIVFLAVALIILVIVFTTHNVIEVRNYRNMYNETLSKLGVSNKDAVLYKQAVYDIIKSLDQCKELKDFQFNLKAFHERIKEIEGDGKSTVQVTLDEFENNPSKFSNFDYMEKQILESDIILEGCCF